jgi:ubiquitin carboxyl-terminal hydrolase L3
MTITWLPLESNPDVMNDYVGKMGLDLSKVQFHDVMSTEDWALEMIPRPVLGTACM